MDFSDKIFLSIAYLVVSFIAYLVAVNISKGFHSKTLRFLFIFFSTILSVPFLAIVFVIVTNKVDKHERW
jgi:hypothetical protein